MTIKELLALNAANLTPSTGDRAYSKYHGITAEGTLVMDNERYGKLNTGGPTPWFIDPKQLLTVGYDHPITWDAEKGMWYAPADAD